MPIAHAASYRSDRTDVHRPSRCDMDTCEFLSSLVRLAAEEQPMPVGCSLVC